MNQDTVYISKLTRVAVYLAISLLLSVAISGVSLYAAFSKKPVVIASDDKGRVIPVVPLNKPYLNDSRVLGFAAECIRRAFSHDFLNYRLSVDEASRCFTSNGAQMYAVAMEGMLKELVASRMIMTAEVSPPVVVRGPIERNGRIVWQVQAKMRLHREGQKERLTPQEMIVDMDVVRVELEESVRGVAVSQFNVRPASSSM